MFDYIVAISTDVPVCGAKIGSGAARATVVNVGVAREQATSRKKVGRADHARLIESTRTASNFRPVAEVTEAFARAIRAANAIGRTGHTRRFAHVDRYRPVRSCDGIGWFGRCIQVVGIGGISRKAARQHPTSG